jgi:hypothetical protein
MPVKLALSAKPTPGWVPPRRRPGSGGASNVTESHCPLSYAYAAETLLEASRKKDSKNKKAGAAGKLHRPFFDLILAATYVPTQLPVQYHRPSEA